MNVVDPDAPLGRDRELAEVEAFLGGPPGGLSALALTGAAGIGKTTVWRWAACQARARGLRVLAIRPGQAERSLSFAGLADLARKSGQSGREPSWPRFPPGVRGPG